MWIKAGKYEVQIAHWRLISSGGRLTVGDFSQVLETWNSAWGWTSAFGATSSDDDDDDDDDEDDDEDQEDGATMMMANNIL